MVESENGEQEARRAWNPTKDELAISIISGILFLFEIIACFFFYYNFYSVDILLYIGWILMILGFIMMAIPQFELSRKGGVPEGKSWVHTTTIVDTGIFGIVRHPLFMGWLIDILALMLISQYLITLLLGIVPFVIVVYYIYVEDRSNVEKFGQPYVDYSMKVPMMNFVLGLIRYRRRNSMNTIEKTD